MVVKKRIIKITGDLNVNGKRSPISQPWYLDYAPILPLLETSGWEDASIENPMILIRSFGYHIYCYENLSDCLRGKVAFLISDRVELPKDEFSLQVSHDEYEDAVNGVTNGMTYAVTKLIAYINSFFVGDVATLETHLINSETGETTLEV